jgi:hypothetical protein
MFFLKNNKRWYQGLGELIAFLENLWEMVVEFATSSWFFCKITRAL